MQIPRDTAALLILRRDEADRKAPQFVRASIDHFFQLNGVVTNRLFQQLAVVNIGAGAIPLNDLSLGISNRKSARPEPTVGAIFRAQTILPFVTPPHFNGVYPNRLTALNVVGVHIVEPTDTLARICRSAGILMNPIADILVTPVSLTAEDDIRRGADNGVEFLVLAYQFGV